MVTSTKLLEIKDTKKRFLILIGGEYLISGFFWVFVALGSLRIFGGDSNDPRPFFFSLFILMLSNGLWEILTGWYADKFKRQLSLTAGFLACLVGFLLMGIAPLSGTDNSVLGAPSLVWNAGITIWSLGPALLSGAREAWLVDRCNFFSDAPPEDVGDVFKKAAAKGMLQKSIGALACFFLILELPKTVVFLGTGIVGLILTVRPLAHSIKL